MKRSVCLLLSIALVFCLLLCSCGDSLLDDLVSAEAYCGYYNAEDGALYADSLNHAEPYSFSDEILRLPLFKFGSETELNDFREKFYDDFQSYGETSESWRRDESFVTKTKKYDAAWFENNSLLLLYVKASSSGDRFELDSAAAEDGKLTLYVKNIQLGSTADMSGRFILVELPDDVGEKFPEYDALIVR